MCKKRWKASTEATRKGKVRRERRLVGELRNERSEQDRESECEERELSEYNKRLAKDISE